MHRSRWMSILLVLAMLVTPLAVLLVPAASVSAAPEAPAATPDDEVILITSALQLRVDDPFTAPGTTPATWNSGADVGWVAVAAGDVNGDGDAEIAAVRGGLIRIFDPFVPPGGTPASGDILAPSGFGWRQILAMADFDRDGRAELAALHNDTAPGIIERLKIYDGGTNGTTWTQVPLPAGQDQFGFPWTDMTTGDFNADGYADLALARYATSPSVTNLIKVFNGLNWSTLTELAIQTSVPLRAIAGGNVSQGYTGSELVALRAVPQAAADAVLVLRLFGNTLTDLPPDRIENRRFSPEFRTVATGDLNGDGDDEIVMARDPQVQTSTSVLMLNPNGPAMPAFELAIGAGANAFRSVRTGDVDADGKDEVVLLRADRYRIYRSPDISTADFIDVLPAPGGAFYAGAAGVINIPFMALANVDGMGRVAGPALAVSPTTLSYDIDFGQAVPPQVIQVTNAGTTDPIAWQAQVLNPQAWLSISPTSGTTPNGFTLTINSTAVNPGQYTATVRVTATTAGVQGSPQDINVSLNLKGSGLVVTPGSLSFNSPYGTIPEQAISISIAVAGATWTAAVEGGQPWLSVTPTSGTSPGTAIVRANTTLAGPGTHTGSIRVTAPAGTPNSPRLVNVTLTVPDPGFVVSPGALSFIQGASNPGPSKPVTIFRPGLAVPWVATALPDIAAATVEEMAASGAITAGDGVVRVDGTAVPAPGWVVMTPDQGTTNPNTPTTMNVSVNPATPPGKYHAVIVIVAQDETLPNRVQIVEVDAWVVATLFQRYLPLFRK